MVNIVQIFQLPLFSASLNSPRPRPIFVEKVRQTTMPFEVCSGLNTATFGDRNSVDVSTKNSTRFEFPRRKAATLSLVLIVFNSHDSAR